MSLTYRRMAVITASTFVAATVGITAAQALWRDSDNTVVAPVPVGNVGFGVSTGFRTSDDDGTYVRETTVASAEDTFRGVPLYVRVPGSVIQQVMDLAPPVFPYMATDEPEQWVVWRFNVYGRADGHFGLNYDIEPVSQVQRGSDTVVRDLAAGVGSYQTLLGHSTMIVFPGSASGDCTAVPGIEGSANVHAVAAPNEPASGVSIIPASNGMIYASQPWCAAVKFNTTPDSEYIADARANALGYGGRIHTHFDQWRAIVAFDPSIPPVGMYGARGTAEGTGEDGSISRDYDEWHSPIRPDPNNEPDVILRISPHVVTS